MKQNERCQTLYNKVHEDLSLTTQRSPTCPSVVEMMEWLQDIECLMIKQYPYLLEVCRIKVINIVTKLCICKNISIQKCTKSNLCPNIIHAKYNTVIGMMNHTVLIGLLTYTGESLKFVWANFRGGLKFTWFIGM